MPPLTTQNARLNINSLLAESALETGFHRLIYANFLATVAVMPQIATFRGGALPLSGGSS